jgi:hypothetical protein
VSSTDVNTADTSTKKLSIELTAAKDTLKQAIGKVTDSETESSKARGGYNKAVSDQRKTEASLIIASEMKSDVEEQVGLAKEKDAERTHTAVLAKKLYDKADKAYKTAEETVRLDHSLQEQAVSKKENADKLYTAAEANANEGDAEATKLRNDVQHKENMAVAKDDEAHLAKIKVDEETEKAKQAELRTAEVQKLGEMAIESAQEIKMSTSTIADAGLHKVELERTKVTEAQDGIDAFDAEVEDAKKREEDETTAVSASDSAVSKAKAAWVSAMHDMEGALGAENAAKDAALAAKEKMNSEKANLRATLAPLLEAKKKAKEDIEAAKEAQEVVDTEVNEADHKLKKATDTKGEQELVTQKVASLASTVDASYQQVVKARDAAVEYAMSVEDAVSEAHKEAKDAAMRYDDVSAAKEKVGVAHLETKEASTDIKSAISIAKVDVEHTSLQMDNIGKKLQAAEGEKVALEEQLRKATERKQNQENVRDDLMATLKTHEDEFSKLQSIVAAKEDAAAAAKSAVTEAENYNAKAKIHYDNSNGETAGLIKESQTSKADASTARIAANKKKREWDDLVELYQHARSESPDYQDTLGVVALDGHSGNR